MAEIKPLTPNPEVMDFLLTRRSRPVRSLQTPVPDRAALMPILTAAARTPDHKKLEPWRFIVLERAALQRLALLVPECAVEAGIDPDKAGKITGFFAHADLVVAVVCAPKPFDGIPRIEQDLSAGAVCLALLNAAHASGWAANWLTGFVAFHQGFLAKGLGLSSDEYVAGYIHIGTEGAVPPDRPRPDIDAITEWVAA